MKAIAAAVAAMGIVACTSRTTDAATKEIVVVVDHAGNATFEPASTTKVSKKAKDEVLFTFKTAYANDRDVFVCALREGNKKKSPWKDCTPTANPPAILGQQFTLKAGTTKDIQCTIKYPRFWFSDEPARYCLFAVDGPVGTTLSCPAAGQDCPKVRVSELALEVEP